MFSLVFIVICLALATLLLVFAMSSLAFKANHRRKGSFRGYFGKHAAAHQSNRNNHV